MTLQYLDERNSIHLATSNGTMIIPDDGTFTLIGDIGLQFMSVLPVNASDCRVTLMGTVGVMKEKKHHNMPAKAYEDEAGNPTYHIGGWTGPHYCTPTLKLTIERGGTGVQGTGVQILEEVVILETSQLDISVTGADFPPAASVLTGEIRYTLFITNCTKYCGVVLSGPVVFNGVAAAGTTGV